jgi:hypothetical protein
MDGCNSQVEEDKDASATKSNEDEIVDILTLDPTPADDRLHASPVFAVFPHFLTNYLSRHSGDVVENELIYLPIILSSEEPLEPTPSTSTTPAAKTPSQDARKRRASPVRVLLLTACRTLSTCCCSSTGADKLEAKPARLGGQLILVLACMRLRRGWRCVVYERAVLCSTIYPMISSISSLGSPRSILARLGLH